ncbi:MAG: hypothetical protein VKJ46_02785 [Leptolyngbyaceae bacterium]|nr:hypothetical protein [Leptolyngbyaceae bacterium]
MVDPDAIVWLNRFLPAWTRISIASQTSLQNLSEIQVSIKRRGLLPGEPIALQVPGTEKDAASSDLLLPVWSQQPTRQIVELRVYSAEQPPIGGFLAGDETRTERGKYFWPNTPVTVTGPDQSFVLGRLAPTQSAKQNLRQTLPFTALQRLQGQVSTPGIWLNLSGQVTVKDTQIAYGQVVHYNPNRTHLSLMLQWASLAGKAPYWQEVTAGGLPELVVDQTVGLEPQFDVYQLKPRNFLPNPIQLEAISLTAPALQGRTYEQILSLARSGLWSPAVQWLQSVKQQLQAKSQGWPAAAQAQMDLLQLHAQITQSQADKDWASPSQAILTSLIDGRWSKALDIFEAAAANPNEIKSLLKTDQGRLWGRVMAALKVNPGRGDVKAWGALIRAAQQDKESAIAWLKQQPQTPPASIAQINKLLQQLEDPLDDRISKSHPSQIVGTATPISTIDPQNWLHLDAGKLKLEQGQAWYHIQVAGFHDGKQWQRAPFSNLKLSKKLNTQQLWTLLGLNLDPQLQVIVWTAEDQQETITATVKAVQMRPGTLSLLAMGQATLGSSLSTSLPDGKRLPSPLSVSNEALQWLEPETTKLADLAQQQPQWVARSLKNLWYELQENRQLPPGRLPSLDIMLNRKGMGSWLVQQIDLTGNNQPEMVVTLDAEALAMLRGDRRGSSQNHLKSRTLIFAESGRLIYSEFRPKEQSLTAIASLKDEGPAALLIDTPRGYSLQRWSSQGQKFK